MNELHLQTSPYLLQHANNPVHWKPWNKQTLSKATQEDKLMIISIGYSTCHWCHVMEQESFEDLEVAELMNKHFINIKVDREELPQIDNYYIKAVQLMTKQAGWPLNAVCLPSGEAIWGGTYFPKEQWMDYLIQLQALYTTNPDQVKEFAQKLQSNIAILSQGPTQNPTTRFNIELLLEKWSKSFDLEYGGYSITPKFMMPNNLLYLQRKAIQQKDTDLLSYIDTSLTKMAWGGIFDPIEGGFCRYSVDHKWHIPHFEKMLYDNAQLLSVYADAYKRTKKTLYKEVLIKTIQFINSSFSNKEGAFYSALDADSKNELGLIKEGAYYYWNKEQLKNILEEDFDLFEKIYNINPYGYWEDSQYVLIQNKPLELIANDLDISLEELESKKKSMLESLSKQKQTRHKPLLDNKVIISWNAQYIVGLLDAYTALKEDTYLQQAKACFDFITQNMYCPDKGLYRSLTNQQKGALAFMDDYAFFIQSAIYLYQHTANPNYLQWAKNLTDYTLDHFWDASSGFFYYSQQNLSNILNSIETEDNVIVSCNSAMAHNLTQLGVLYHNAHYSKVATNMLEVILSQIDYPSAYSNWLLLQLYYQSKSELVLVGEKALEKTLELRQNVITSCLIFPKIEHCKTPYLQKEFTKDHTLAYLCTNNMCLAPEKKLNFLQQYTL